jgi:methylated-DNA-[protein]-cysteine S-methyltransferase
MKGSRVLVHTVQDSPVGPLTLVALDGKLRGLYMNLQRHRPPEATFGEPDPTPFTEVIRQLDEYFGGQRTEFNLPMNLVGTPFQRTVWAALQEIPYGETRSYGQLAVRIGRPGAARAVGLANGRNPIGIIVPCHRVVGASGDLTGYGGGLERKQHLLDFERRQHGSAHEGMLFEVAAAMRTPTDSDRRSPQNGGAVSNHHDPHATTRHRQSPAVQLRTPLEASPRYPSGGDAAAQRDVPDGPRGDERDHCYRRAGQEHLVDAIRNRRLVGVAQRGG